MTLYELTLIRSVVSGDSENSEDKEIALWLIDRDINLQTINPVTGKKDDRPKDKRRDNSNSPIDGE